MTYMKDNLIIDQNVWIPHNINPTHHFTYTQ